MVLLFLIGKLLYIHFVDGKRYEKIVLDQQEYSSQTIPFKRGDIVDRNQTILATSTDVYNVILDCKVLNAKKDCQQDTIEALYTCFGLDKAIVEKELKDKATSQYDVLLKKISYEETAAFRKMAEDNSKIKGVWFEKEYKRSYPYNTLAASVIGFTTSGDEGINGLEKYYNDTLNGTMGREYGYLNSDSNYEKTVIEPEDGKTIVTTIDVAIQSIVEKKILEFNKEHSGRNGTELGSNNTAVMVMNPNTGEILAMADYPSYDLNNPRDLSGIYSQAQLDKMSDEETLDALNLVWNNFCITDTYEPGSTIKPFTVATGLDSGKLKGNETYYCDGHQKVGDHNIHCANRNGHGQETLEQALNNSCNDALMQIGATIGANTFLQYQQTFGFGKKTGVDLPGEARTDSLVYTLDTMNATALATNAFGQNFNVTMVQLCSGFCSLINGGNYYQPHLVKEVLNADKTTDQTIEPLLVRQTISPETSSYIRKYLFSTVNVGTAQSAKVPGYTMGGKTGTAEKLPRGNKKYLVSFIGFVPANDPQVVIYVIIDEPNVERQAQSSLATNLAKEILKDILPYMNLYPDEGKENSVPKIESVEESYEDGIFE